MICKIAGTIYPCPILPQLTMNPSFELAKRSRTAIRLQINFRGPSINDHEIYVLFFSLQRVTGQDWLDWSQQYAAPAPSPSSSVEISESGGIACCIVAPSPALASAHLTNKCQSSPSLSAVMLILKAGSIALTGCTTDSYKVPSSLSSLLLESPACHKRSLLVHVPQGSTNLQLL
jgi:hypothetical protein